MEPGDSLYLLATLTLLLSAADHWTTYLCLRTRVEGWTVTEVNPIADWLFQSMGLVPGLVLDSVVTIGAVAFLIQTHRLPKIAKQAFFVIVCAGTAYAVDNNLRAIGALGLSPLGIG